MGAFLNSVYEEGTPTEIAYWIGKMEAEYAAAGKLTKANTPDYNVIMSGKKDQLINELAKVSP